MDRLEQYRQFIEQILTEHAEIFTTTDTDVKPQLIFDRERDHYQLSYVGWQGDKRVFGPVMHFDIEDGKIWVQYNGMERKRQLPKDWSRWVYLLQILFWGFIPLLSANLPVMQ